MMSKTKIGALLTSLALAATMLPLQAFAKYPESPEYEYETWKVTDERWADMLLSESDPESTFENRGTGFISLLQLMAHSNIYNYNEEKDNNEKDFFTKRL